ncbi:MAG: hypothetical protein P4L87_21965 [Formivibrio sp.]|nr:hypothetical protein [Formivibrio sp.]
MAAAPIGDVNPSVRKVLSKAEVSRIVGICAQWGWPLEAKKIAKFPYAVEQEGIVCTSAQYFSVMTALERMELSLISEREMELIKTLKVNSGQTDQV